MRSDPATVLEVLADGIASALGAELRGLYVHGSYTAGDFAAARSDLDLLAVLAQPPTTATLAHLRVVHDAIDVDHPTWSGRVEVGYLGAATLATLAGTPGPMIRISPGEPLHLVEATRHTLLDVASARDTGRAVRGPDADALLPEVEPSLLRAVVLEDVAQWPEWVRRVGDRVGAQAYAVLTLCRARQLVLTGTRASKRTAAAGAATALHVDAELIAWASHWWYHGGRDTEPSRGGEVEGFARRVGAEIARAAAADPIAVR